MPHEPPVHALRLLAAAVCAAVLCGCATRYPGPMAAAGTLATLQLQGLDGEADSFLPRRDLVPFAIDSRLAFSTIRWTCLSIGDDLRLDGRGNVHPDIALAIAIRHDMPRVMDAANRLNDRALYDTGALEEFDLDGVRAWRHNAASRLRGICYASLDGELMLIANSPEALVRQIRLYRDGEGESAEFMGLHMEKDEVAHLFVPFASKAYDDVRRITRDASGETPFPDVNRRNRTYGALRVRVTEGPRDTYVLTATVEAKNDIEAEELRAALRGTRFAAKALLALRARRDPALRAYVRLVDALEIGGSAGEVSVRTVLAKERATALIRDLIALRADR